MDLQLRVVPNPFSAVDHLGRPCAAVLAIHLNGGKFRDQPKHTNPAARWAPRPHIGASIKATRLSADRTIRLKGRATTIRGKFDHAWTHALDPVTLTVAEDALFHFHYMRAIKAGELLAADAETWAAAQLPAEHFQEPAEKLAQAKEGAIAQWIATHHADKLAAARDPGNPVPLTESLKAGVDPRLDNLVMHLAKDVEQRHPVGKAIEAQKRAAAAPPAPAPQTPAPPPAPAAPEAQPAPAKTARVVDSPTSAKPAAPSKGV